MTATNIEKARSPLGKRLDRALAGEEVVISRAGKPVARLVPIAGPAPRRPGIARGRVTDAFFDPLPEAELAAWEARP